MTARGMRTKPRPGKGKRPPDAARWARPGFTAAGVAAVVVAAIVVTVVLLNRGDVDGGGHQGALGRLPGEDPGIAHVHGLGVDPADGTLYAATHYGLFRIPEGGKATRVANRYQDTMGFTVVGPRHFLGSGHPDPRENLPPRLGLIESTDGGETWKTLSLSGEADMHSLEFRHGRVYGYDSASGRLMVSTDRTSWDRRASVPLADLAVSPSRAETILATTERGLARSTDGGRTFSPVANAPALIALAWPTGRVLYGAGADGSVYASTTGGDTWQPRGRLDGQPEAIAAPDENRLIAATGTGIHASVDGGRTFNLRYRDGNHS